MESESNHAPGNLPHIKQEGGEGPRICEHFFLRAEVGHMGKSPDRDVLNVPKRTA